jgi:hypothetical protein
MAHRLSSLVNLWQRVETFPNEVTQPCLLSLGRAGKVAFSHGEVIHTNEFLVQGRWLSHKGLRRWIQMERGKQENCQKVESLMSTAKEGGGTHPARGKSYMDDRDYCPANKHDTDHGDCNDAYYHDSDKDMVLSDDAGSNGIFEIREYLDSDGNEIKSDVIDVTKQLGKFSSAITQKYNEISAIPDEVMNNLPDRVHARDFSVCPCTL